MQFKDIIGQKFVKSHLKKSADTGRVSHAQLFVGPEGSGTLPMAIAYANYILCEALNPKDQVDSELSIRKAQNLSHPDLHFAFPVATNDKIKKHPVSKMFLEEWRQLIKEQPYGNLFDWYRILGIDNKQGQIGVDEAQEIVKALSLKSYEGGFKVMIIWMAEKMNSSASNKLLKLIEEPPSKTIFILVAENEESIIKTIKSRCQIIHFPPLAEVDIKIALKERYQLDELTASKIAHQSNGNFNKASDLVYQDSEDFQFEKWFVVWVRSAFKAKGNKSSIHDLISWSEEIAKTGRETQKQFLLFCMDFFRQAMLKNYSADSLVYLDPQTKDFSLEKFAPFIHDANIVEINKELQDAFLHIERNGNSKIILTDLSIKLTRLIHKKSRIKSSLN